MEQDGEEGEEVVGTLVEYVVPLDVPFSAWLSAIVEADSYFALDGLRDCGALVDLLRNPALPLLACEQEWLLNLFARHQLKSRSSPRNPDRCHEADAAYAETLRLLKALPLHSGERAVVADHLARFRLAKRQGGEEVPSYLTSSHHEAQFDDAIEEYHVLRSMREHVTKGTKVMVEGHATDLHDAASVRERVAAIHGVLASALAERLDGKSHSRRRLAKGKRGRP